MNARPRVLLLGARGRVGSAVLRALARSAEVLSAGRNRADAVALDLLRPQDVPAALERAGAQVVINAAGYAAVDAAEAEPALAHALNAVAPAALSEACARRGTLLVHVGSDYVFDGSLGRPYREEDAPHPLGVYGRSKWAGEQAVLASSGPHLVLRTAWVFSRGRGGFLDAFERALALPEPVRAVDDQWGSPTGAHDFAAALAAVLARLSGLGPRGDLDARAVAGLYHVVCPGGATWFDFATLLRELLGRPTPVVAVARADRPQAAPRPRDSRLDPARLERVFGVRLPPWPEALRRCLRAPA